MEESGELPITSYAPNPAEWFAEIFRLFVTNHGLLKQLRPKTYNILLRSRSMHLTTRNVNTAFRELVEGIHSGKIPTVVTASRNGEVAAVEEPVVITYTHPRERVLFNAVRDANPFLHIYESLWMLAGRRDVAPLAYYAKQFKEYSDDGWTLNGAYGYRWRHAETILQKRRIEGDYYNPCSRTVAYVDQLQILIDHLKKNPYSRRAVLQMWNVEEDLLKIGGWCPTCEGKWTAEKAKNLDENPTHPCPNCSGIGKPFIDSKMSKDVCCNLSVLFAVEMGRCTLCGGMGKTSHTSNMQHFGMKEFMPGGPYEIPEGSTLTIEGQCPGCNGKPHDRPQYLNMTVFNRSNDLLWGALGANAVHFSFLQEYMAANLGLEVGKYNQISNNLHVYTERRDWNPEKLLECEDGEVQRRYFPELEMVPLIREPKTFDRELPEFVERHSKDSMSCAYEEPFLNETAQPLLIAFHHYKRDDLDYALATANTIKADDWRIAATAWIKRRILKRKEKQSAGTN